MPPGDSKLHRSFTEALRGAWRTVARPEQIAPDGAWVTWIFCGGRGAGKTRSGAEWVTERVASGARFVHLIAPTVADTRDVMLEGPAGILKISPPHMQPIYQPSLRKLIWPNGAQALLFSSDEPDRLRGPQCDVAWIDELCAMRQAQEVLDNMYFGLRVGKDPRCLITTTPRPLKCFKALLARDGQDVIVTRSSSFANRDNLAPAFFSQITAKYAGTRLGRQELEAELLTDTPGALWHLEQIEGLRVRVAPQPLERVLVAIDPAVTHGPDSDETGIVVVGLGADGCGYLLDDVSGRYPPEEWARRAIQAYRTYSADRIIGETNNGGALVEHTLRSVDPGIPFTAVHASRGKLTRAEPVSALYEQGKVHHVGVFGPLEDQMTSYDGSRGGASPDRLDALVWGLSALMLGEPPGRYIREETLLRADAAGVPAPVDMPDQVERMFAVAATVESEPGALAVVYFALSSDPLSAIILDWNIQLLDQSTLETLLPAVALRLSELREHCTVHSRAMPLIVDPVGVGNAVFEIGVARGFRVVELDERLCEQGLVSRVVELGAYLNAGAVKLVHEACSKRMTFRGVHRNHLTAEVTAFGAEDEKPKVGALLAALAAGVLQVLSPKCADPGGWRALARAWNGTPEAAGPVSLASLLAGLPPAPPASAPQERLLDPEILKLMHQLGWDRPRAERLVQQRIATQAQLEREHIAMRAAAAEREQKARERVLL